jgi:hypothetical protein
VAGLPAQPGDRVDLLASASTDDAPSGASSSPSEPVARAALVVAAHGTTLIVAVSPDDAVRIAAAMGRGALVPALDGPG